MEYWYSSICNRWLVADKGTGGIVAQCAKRRDVYANYPAATLCFEMGE